MANGIVLDRFEDGVAIVGQREKECTANQEPVFPLDFATENEFVTQHRCLENISRQVACNATCRRCESAMMVKLVHLS